MILLIDNYDSFTHNLAQLIETEQEVVVVRNDDEKIYQLAEQARAIVISPGPGRPNEAGEIKKVIQKFYQIKPILGICLGHQAIGEVFGAQISSAQQIRHGKQSMISIREKNQLFQGIEKNTAVMRYHSLIIEPQTLPSEFTITAIADDDQEIMAIEHKIYPVFGFQFHPESIGTLEGQTMIKNFIQLTEERSNE
ncbi:anthranilate synthase component II [Enterococcus sp. 5H]|uniref:anthranilate synthase component II n=1 Tax=Enterococcus sp. 5H TaxID=1229490 RepID=UPI002302E469|nr:aminodeoxychorismate/anthranilate synthase component II [Enterococcus sp. 5H]MDA9471274.1 Anthranilate synthase, amidotransferase component [Enterococcus sp. 5H]